MSRNHNFDVNKEKNKSQKVYVMDNQKHIFSLYSSQILNYWKKSKETHDIQKIAFFHKDNGWCSVQRGIFGDYSGFCCAYLGIPCFGLQAQNSKNTKNYFILEALRVNNKCCHFIEEKELKGMLEGIIDFVEK